MIGRPPQLSAAEFDVVWRAADLGEPPLVLRVPSPGRTGAERARIEAGVWSALRERELADADGMPAGKLVSRLTTIARATTAIELRGWEDGEIRATVGRAGRTAVAIVIRTGEVSVSTAPVTGLARTIVGLLPARAAGPGHSVTVPTADYAAAVRTAPEGPALRNALVHRGLRAADARALVEMATGGDRFWQFAAVVRDRDGTARRSSRVVTVRGDARRSYLLTRRVDAHSDHLTLAPAGTAKIVSSLEDLVAGVRDR